MFFAKNQINIDKKMIPIDDLNTEAFFLAVPNLEFCTNQQSI